MYQRNVPGGAKRTRSVTRKGTGKPIIGTFDLGGLHPQSNGNHARLRSIIMQIIQDKKALLKAIKSAGLRGKKLEQYFQEMLVSAAWHYKTSKDSSVLTACVLHAPDSYRLDDCMIPWITANFECRWDKEKRVFKKKETSTFLDENTAFAVNKYSDIKDNAWWNFAGAKATKPWTLEGKCLAFVRDILRHDEEAQLQASSAKATTAMVALQTTLDELKKSAFAKVA